MIRKILVAVIVFITVGCNQRDKGDAMIFLSNISLDSFEESSFRVFVNDELILTDSIKNKYVSSHWKESKIKVPKDNFNFRVIISGEGYELEKDTTVSYSDSLKLFIRFNFYPHYKRYRNPDIYRYLPPETTRLKEIADSLYAKDVLLNANEYLNDTIPLKKNMEISIQ
jgi:hypothetical protein